MVALRLGARAAWASAAGAAVCFAVRMLAVRFHWHLPGGVSCGLVEVHAGCN